MCLDNNKYWTHKPVLHCLAAYMWKM